MVTERGERRECNKASSILSTLCDIWLPIVMLIQPCIYIAQISHLDRHFLIQIFLSHMTVWWEDGGDSWINIINVNSGTVSLHIHSPSQWSWDWWYQTCLNISFAINHISYCRTNKWKSSWNLKLSWLIFETSLVVILFQLLKNKAERYKYCYIWCHAIGYLIYHSIGPNNNNFLWLHKVAIKFRP